MQYLLCTCAPEIDRLIGLDGELICEGVVDGFFVFYVFIEDFPVLANLDESDSGGFPAGRGVSC